MVPLQMSDSVDVNEQISPRWKNGNLKVANKTKKNIEFLLNEFAFISRSAHTYVYLCIICSSHSLIRINIFLISRRIFSLNTIIYRARIKQPIKRAKIALCLQAQIPRSLSWIQFTLWTTWDAVLSRKIGNGRITKEKD